MTLCIPLQLSPYPFNGVQFWVKLWEKNWDMPFFQKKMLYHTFFILEIVMLTQCLPHVISNHPSGVNSSLLQHSFHSFWNSQAECQ